MDTHPLIALKQISKSFGSAKVLHEVDFALMPGSVHALTGENGAGKSTMMKILAGVHRPDSGNVEIKGKTVRISSPAHAREMGVSTVFQEFTLIPNLSIGENIFLGREPLTPTRAVHYAEIERKGDEILRRIGLPMSSKTLVSNLTVAQQQAVEIAKGLAGNADVFIFDEPTAALNEADVENLHRIILELKSEGKGIIYVSHRLKEIFRLCDKTTVLKDGRLVATRDTSTLDEHSLVALMVGRELLEFFPPRGQPAPIPALEVNSLQLKAGSIPFGFKLCRGEILGLAGLEGQGQREIARALVGVEAPSQLSATKFDDQGVGKPLRAGKGIAAVIAQGVGFVPEDRKAEGLFLALPIADNIALGRQIGKALFAIADASKVTVNGLMEKMNIGASGPTAPVKSLSGGNQQRVLLARWLASGVDTLVIEEPTRGVDVGAKAEIYRLLRKFVAEGGAILVLSREMQELIGLCDRILVVHEQHIVAETAAAVATEHGILHSAIGSKPTSVLIEQRV
jgi:ribose transport system ATP-binding protein